MVKLEVKTSVLILLVGVLALWVNTTRKGLTMKKLDRQIFDGK